MSGTVVIGVGNEFRGDDGAGRIVARRLGERVPPGVTVHESTGEALSLMGLWGGARRVILVDAADAGGDPGAVTRMEASAAALPARYFHASTHAFSVAEAVELARSLGQLPETVIVYGIQGASFAHGGSLTPDAARGVAEAVDRILAEISPDTP